MFVKTINHNYLNTETRHIGIYPTRPVGERGLPEFGVYIVTESLQKQPCDSLAIVSGIDWEQARQLAKLIAEAVCDGAELLDPFDPLINHRWNGFTIPSLEDLY